ncbi:MAG: molybdopterin-synthase adenylyltransferase MoeB [Microscillaceae bacterium]|nr:molybdopterin-synthase adenylyltransferase MoeB [Microscillaceae bacterium]
MFRAEEYQRYNRHLIMPEVGLAGQAKLQQAKVLVVGAGGLGCPVLQYLAAAGVGNLGIVDGDKIDISNLQRQILYTTAELGQSKARVAQTKIQALNPHVYSQAFDTHLTRDNALKIIADYDLVVDCTDNFPTRYLINDACVILQKTLIFGAIYKFEGQVSVFNFPLSEQERSATYRCLFPKMPNAAEVPNCAEAGVIGVLPGIIGTLQANEVIKIIVGLGEPLANQIWLLDALTLQSRKIKFKRIPEQANISQLTDYQEVCITSPNKNPIKSISPQTLQSELTTGKDWQIIDVREDYEFEICHLPQAQLIPLGQIRHHIAQIATHQPVVVYCHHGMRSAKAIQELQKIYPFNNLYNLAGGIHAWATEVDIEMMTY